MARISANRAVMTRLLKLRKSVEVDTQRLRAKMLASLDEICEMAARIAKGEIKRQRESDD